jgi:peptide/nickel transport system substrate-binding protein
MIRVWRECVTRKTPFLISSILILTALLVVSCKTTSPETITKSTPVTTTGATTPPKPATTAATTTAAATAAAASAPKYGGVMRKFIGADMNWLDTIDQASGSDVMGVVTQPMWAGDWTKGAAGGFGTKQTDWGASNVDNYDLKTGYVAESVKWTVDAAANQGTVIAQIRQGIRWANNGSEASALVAGRELTADDVVATLKRNISKGSYLSGANPELLAAEITKSGPREVTVKVPLNAVVAAMTRLFTQSYIQPPEVIQKYGSMRDWRSFVGSGPFMFKDYVSGNSITLVKNPNYWMKDPIGPGKGNQLPYLDGIKLLIIPDISTQKAALVTGKLDFTNGTSTTPIGWEDAEQISKTNPKLVQKESPSYQGRGTPMFMRTDKAPFSDIRVRKAMMLAVDYKAILNSLFRGKGEIVTWPYAYSPDYSELYLGLDDPQFPAEGKDLYQYNPAKAKQLLAEAGYASGFKTELLITSTEADYYSILKDMYSKVGIEVAFNIVEGTVKNNILKNRAQVALTTGTTGPANNFWVSTSIWGNSQYNCSILDDPEIAKWMAQVQLDYPVDIHKSMKDFKELAKYMVTKAYVVPNVQGSVYAFWQPWIRNYSGEWTMTGNIPMWGQFVWYDSTMRSDMGY